MFGLKRFLKEEKAAGVVEMILILVVLIGLVVIFKDRITFLINKVFGEIFDLAGDLW